MIYSLYISETAKQDIAEVFLWYEGKETILIYYFKSVLQT